eukprot:TRINITY_DN12801_c0_g1_i1.p1 TRINITY_DN12801_c0_g1~~TRINITY_DN12801_c0_g1_i1.p1  ORF type:complete len:268 (-),score=67.26 TRINITY_DN12801_c0_g1_i1:162-965(-)
MSEQAASEVGSQHSQQAAASPSRSLNAKRMRLAAESDVQFLANRIAKLKAEEEKAKKEIEKTKQKTNAILGSRKQHEAKNIDRLTLREQIANSKKEERVLVSLNKAKQLEAIWMAKKKKLDERREACARMRKEKEINECRIHIQKEEERDKNIRKREDIRKQQVYSKMKRDKEAEDKQKVIRREYEERIAREEQDREKKERLATQLVTQEAQLIYRLKKLHMEKQSAIQGLATAVDCVKADEIEEEIEGEAGTEDEAGYEVEEDVVA